MEKSKFSMVGIPEIFTDIDVLINNAGKALGKEQIGSIEDADNKEMFAPNVFLMM